MVCGGAQPRPRPRRALRRLRRARAPRGGPQRRVRRGRGHDAGGDPARRAGRWHARDGARHRHDPAQPQGWGAGPAPGARAATVVDRPKSGMRVPLRQWLYLPQREWGLFREDTVRAWLRGEGGTRGSADGEVVESATELRRGQFRTVFTSVRSWMFLNVRGRVRRNAVFREWGGKSRTAREYPIRARAVAVVVDHRGIPDP
ncbi:hypothetical protein D7M15_04535 [Streptomyces sp. Z26]|nr:hypothetical protein D7M15_04535 [Streptomyces sp. Z26]